MRISSTNYGRLQEGISSKAIPNRKFAAPKYLLAHGNAQSNLCPHAKNLRKMEPLFLAPTKS